MILVFGKTGQVSRELAGLADVQCFGRYEADLSNPEKCAALIQNSDCQAVINAAAYTAMDKAEEEEDLANLINGDAPSAMAQAAREKDIPFVHISTDYVFDGLGETPWKPDDKTSPINAYGRSKLKGEIGVEKAGGKFAILRTSWVFSAHGHNFVKSMLKLGCERDALNIVADQIGGPTPSSEIAKACHSMALQLQKDASKSGIYHFSGAPDTSWAGFAREIFAVAGRDVTVENIPTSAYPTPATRPLNSRLDCSSLETDFGIKRPDWRALQPTGESIGVDQVGLTSQLEEVCHRLLKGVVGGWREN